MVWVDPRTIRYETRIVPEKRIETTSSAGRNLERWAAVLSNRLEPFIRVESGFSLPPLPIHENARYARLAQLVSVLPNFKASDWYRSLLHNLKANACATYKNLIFESVHQIDAFFEQRVIPLISSLKNDGFRPNASHDYPRGIIWSDGQLMKSIHGNHRFILSQMLGVPSVPIELDAIHRDWWDSHVAKRLTIGRLVEVGNRYSDTVTAHRRQR